MTATKPLIDQLYTTFNQRDIDGALALMTETITWPKASEGGRVTGKEAIRAYWTRQWSEFDPYVNPIEIAEPEPGKIEVKVHQLVKSLHGDLLSDSHVTHIFTTTNGLVDRMDLGDSGVGPAPSSAFAHY